MSDTSSSCVSESPNGQVLCARETLVSGVFVQAGNVIAVGKHLRATPVPII